MRHLGLLFTALFPLLAWGQGLVIALDGAGSLSEAATAANLKKNTHVTIKGTMNGEDFLFLRNCLKKGSESKVEVLNLSEVKIVGGGSYDDGLGKLSVHPYTNLVAQEDVIGNAMFHEFSSLTSLILPTQLKEIGSWCFRGCSKLKSLSIPEGVTKIGEGICENDHELVEVTLPSTLQSIGNNSFLYCSSLDKVTARSATPPTLGSSMFSSFAPKSVLTVPSGAKQEYEDRSQWNEFQTIVETSTTAVDGIMAGTALRSSSLFDLQGRRVSGRPQRGVYIRDGRKAMVR